MPNTVDTTNEDCFHVRWQVSYWLHADCAGQDNPSRRDKIYEESYQMLHEGEMHVEEFLVQNVSSGYSRHVSVFLPKLVETRSEMPVIYCADGQVIASIAPALTKSMQNGQIPPAILVGIHSSPDMRNRDYLLGIDQACFEAHEEFFVRFVRSWVSTHLGIPSPREMSAVFGFSNGGSFAVSIGVRNPDKFGTVIAFSVARIPASFSIPRVSRTSAQRYYLAAGKTGAEKMFRKYTAGLAKRLKRRKVAHIYFERNAGHELRFWQQELVSAISWAFDGRVPNEKHGV